MATRVNPTRMELTKTKKRLATAIRGHKLLKDKQDEMARRFMFYINRNRELRLEVDKLLTKAMQNTALAEAQMGKSAIFEALFLPSASGKAEYNTQNIMSVIVPDIKVLESKSVSTLPYSTSFTSEYLDRATLIMKELMPKLIELASVEKTCDMLADELERTRRRVNALEYVMIAEMKGTIKYISMKLEDNERSNLTRLMKVKDMMKEE
ncbi:MAG: V-type ATP synthase subunit D [Ruminococcaceae bacterium]|nr:V-type ATP synthase subunit D [Oscillospiraceae bacterium]